MRWLETACLGASAIVAVSASACSSGGSDQAASGAQLVADASAKAEAQGSTSIRIVATSVTGKTSQPVEELSSKVSAPAASQRLRFSSGGGNLDVRLIGSTAYVRADATTLYKGLALTKQDAPTYAGRWISLVQTDSPFSSIADTMTLKSQLATFLPVGRSVSVGETRRLDGHDVIPLTGKAAKGGTGGRGVVRLLIDARSKLPVGAGVVKAGSGTTLKIVARFSDWGKPVEVTAPPDAVPYDSVVGRGG